MVNGSLLSPVNFLSESSPLPHFSSESSQLPSPGIELIVFGYVTGYNQRVYPLGNESLRTKSVGLVIPYY